VGLGIPEYVRDCCSHSSGSAASPFGAAAGIFAFRQVGDRLELIGARVPLVVSSLEISRAAIGSLRRLQLCSPSQRRRIAMMYRSGCARNRSAHHRTE
jgi:hypothetical protein